MELVDVTGDDAEVEVDDVEDKDILVDAVDDDAFGNRNSNRGLYSFGGG